MASFVLMKHNVPLPRPTILDGYDHSAYWIRAVTRHQCLQIAQVNKGSCELKLTRQTVHVGEGDILLLDPSQDIQYRPRDKKMRFSGLLCDWTDRRLQPVQPDAPLKGWQPLPGEAAQPGWQDLLGYAVPPVLPRQLSRSIAPLLHRAVRGWWRSATERLRANSHLLQILILLSDWEVFDAKLPEETPANDDLSQRAHAWVREHIYERPSVTEVARGLGLTRAHYVSGPHFQSSQ